MNSDKLEKLIHSLINKKDENFDSEKLKAQFDKMSESELSIFWSMFSSSEAAKQSYMGVPHWETSNRNKLLEEISNDLHFKPTERDSNGKYIIDKIELERHIGVIPASVSCTAK